MKKIILLLIITIISLSCVTSKNKRKSDDLYNVFKLDSINNYYLIYAKKHDTVYKIICQKQIVSHCNKLKLGTFYKFDLYSIRENAPVISGIKMNEVNYLDIKCYQFDENTSICKEDGIYDLYFARNIKGLCFTD
jgi:hypothetical protein